MLRQWSDVETATKKAYESEGTAAKENEKYMNSMQGKIAATQAAWQALSNSFLSSDFLKGLIDGGGTALNILNNIISKLGTLPTLLITIGSYLSIKKPDLLKALPTYIKNLNDAGNAIRKVSNVSKAINIGVGDSSLEQISAYQRAIKGLNAEQAVAALSTQKLNAAQIEEIMTTESATLAKGTYTQADVQAALAKQGLASSTTILTVAQQTELVNSGILTSEKLSEIAATLGLQTAENGELVSKEALNLENVKQQLTSLGVVGAQQAQVLSVLGLTAAEGGAITATNLLTGAFNLLKASMAAHPIGWIIAGVAALVAGLVALSHVLPTVENTTKWLKESSQEVKDLQNDINSLNDKLTTTKTRIEELLKKPSLTIVEQNELDRLQRTNSELEREIQLKERALQIAQGKNSKNFVNATEATRNTKDDKDLWNNDSTAIAIMSRQYVDMGTESYDAESFFNKVLEAYKNAEATKANATEEELKNIPDLIIVNEKKIMDNLQKLLEKVKKRKEKLLDRKNNKAKKKEKK